jgi:hypothetical protein
VKLAHFRVDWRESPEKAARQIVERHSERMPSLAPARARRDAIAIPEITVTRRPFAGTLLG